VYPSDAGQPGQVLAVNSLEILGIGDHDAEQIVKLSRHQIAVHHFGQRSNRVFEDPKLVLILTFEGDAHKNYARESRFLGVDPSRIALNGAFFLQRSDSPKASGFREVDPLGELDVRDAALELEDG
jgi:hypothetical protein